ncbi:hypothetical protein SRHO_G00320250 [Serrasalmus rhombeus]
MTSVLPRSFPLTPKPQHLHKSLKLKASSQVQKAEGEYCKELGKQIFMKRWLGRTKQISCVHDSYRREVDGRHFLAEPFPREATEEEKVVIEENGEVIHSPSPCVEITSLTPPGFATSSDHFTTSMAPVYFSTLGSIHVSILGWVHSSSAPAYFLILGFTHLFHVVSYVLSAHLTPSVSVHLWWRPPGACFINPLSSRTRMTSRCPLAEIRIQQFNFIDIIYELVLLGVLRGARPPIFPRPRGFLSHLMAMLYSISTATEHRMLTAEECMFHVQIEMFLLLDDLFSEGACQCRPLEPGCYCVGASVLSHSAAPGDPVGHLNIPALI